MSSPTHSSIIDEFVDLDRRFSEVTKRNGDEEAAFESYAAGLMIRTYHSKSWSELLSAGRVVILGEAGSGKSAELQQQQKILTAKGSPAFYLRLDELATHGWEFAVGGQLKSFVGWRAGAMEAAFFLDSVDESKLRYASDFHTAVERFAHALGTELLQRATIVISSRITGWLPETDGPKVINALGRKVSDKKPAERKSQRREPSSPLLVVQIVPLDRARVEQFARSRGIEDVAEFLTALDRAHAWEFAGRPLDVIDLASFWTRNSRIGSLTELIEYSVGRKLQEAPNRANLDLLSPARAREGAEALAAGTLFCRQLTFKVADVNLVTGALQAHDCLPDSWTPPEAAALLERAVFDGASFGKIRFHHRRTSEYLAASWLAHRVELGFPLSDLIDLLFERIRERRIIRASMAATAAWLCSGTESWREHIRAAVLESAPEIHLRYGDPANLPITYKRHVLQALVTLSQGRERVWYETQSDALARLAEPALEPDIFALIRERKNPVDLRSEMLQVARFSRLPGALRLALAIVANPEESDSLKIIAAATIRDIGDEPSRRELQSILRNGDSISERLAGVLVDALFGEIIEPEVIVTLAEKVVRGRKKRRDLSAHVIEVFRERVTPRDSLSLLARLVPLSQRLPHRQPIGLLPLSDQFGWLARTFQTPLSQALQRSSLSPDEVEIVVGGLLAYEATKPDDELRGKPDDLHEVSLRHPPVRQLYFWLKIGRLRANDPKWFERYREVFGYSDTALRPDGGDISWLLDDLAGRADPLEREVAIRQAYDVRLHRDIDRQRVIASIKGNRELELLARSLHREAVKRRFTRWRYQWVHRWHEIKMKRRRAIGAILNGYRRFKGERRLKRDLPEIAAGRLPGWLYYLLHEADQPSDRWTVGSFAGLVSSRGVKIAEVTRDGCKRAWRLYEPKLPHERKDRRGVENDVIVGLAGLHAMWVDGELAHSHLSATDAARAVRYALLELNQFPAWLATLSRDFPETVLPILEQCVDFEWDAKFEPNADPQVLRRFGWSKPEVSAIVVPHLLKRIQRAGPLSYGVLEPALSIITKQTSPPRALLAEIARGRCGPDAPVGIAAVWFALWMQIDAAPALDALSAEPEGERMSQLMVSLCHLLAGEQPGPFFLLAEASYLEPRFLQRWIPLVYQHVKESEDLNSEGGTPSARDYAERYRGSVLHLLAKSRDPEAALALHQLSMEPRLRHIADWIVHLRDDNIARCADLPRWNEPDIRSLAETHETDPHSDRELNRLALKRLQEIKQLVEGGDQSPRQELRDGDNELALRRWLARRLQLRAGTRFVIVEEAEVDRRERPDIRFTNQKTGPVSVELKWLESWSVPELLRSLEHQLVGQYLRDENNCFGIFVVGRIGSRTTWMHETRSLSGEEVITVLQHKARELSVAHPREISVAVVALDFRPPIPSRKF